MAGPAYRPDIDGLRALAVAGVVVFHAAPQALPGGFAGVDVFFVISGFLIGSIIAKDVEAGRFSFLAFYQRRIRRLLPAMALVLLASVLAGAILLVPSEFSTLTFTLRATILYASNIVFALRTGYFDQAGAASPLLHTWSLSIEEQFYLVCPLLLWGIHRFRPKAVVPVLVLLALLSGAAGIHGALSYPEKAFFLPHTRMWELLLGVILAHRRVLEGATDATRQMIGWLGLAAILLAFASHSGDRTPYPGVHALLPGLGTMMLIEANRYAPTWSGRLLSLRPLVYLGLISYPLYLWHWPILVYLRMFGPEWSALAPSLAAMLVALMLADLTRRFVEQPWRHAPAAGWRRDYAALAIVSIAFIGLSLISEATKGLPQRFSPDVRATLQAGDEWRDSQRLACMKIGSNPDLAAREAASHPCRIGRPGAPVEVVLWGDSHAAALQPGLDAALKAGGRGGIVITGGCTAVSPGSERAGCEARRSEILRDFAQGPALTLVVAQRWSALVEGVMPIEREFRRRTPGESAQGAQKLAGGLRDLSAWVGASGKQLVIAGTVPEMDFNVPNSVGFRQNLGLRLPEGPDIGAVRIRQNRSAAAIETGLLGSSARYLDPVPFFCTPACAVTGNGVPLYFDNNHLTIAATEKIRAMFAAPFPPIPQ